jgi:hypothetical protein
MYARLYFLAVRGRMEVGMMRWLKTEGEGET